MKTRYLKAVLESKARVGLPQREDYKLVIRVLAKNPGQLLDQLMLEEPA